MEVEIGDLVSSVHAVDGAAPLSPAVMAEIIRVVTEAVRRDLGPDRRVRRERALGDDRTATRSALEA